jgi:hypothetical protein
MLRAIGSVVVAVAIVSGSASASYAATDPNVLCHKTVVKQLEKYKKTHLKLYRNCLDKENKGVISGPCLDAVSVAKLADTNLKVTANIVKKCQLANLATLGYRTDCQYGPATPGIGGTCFGLPVTTVTEFAECLKCWKGAEFARVEGILYASHAQEVCGTALDNTSTTCAAVGCVTPLPEQHDLGDTGENDCQRMLSKATMNYLLKREHILENCLLKFGSLATCLADPKVQLQLSKAETQKETLIEKKCNNRNPVASPPFCCNTGPAQTCVAALDRNDCVTNLGGAVKEGKVCNAGTCDAIGGPNHPLTWWESCPSNEPCPGPTLGDMDGVIGCVDSIADGVVDTLLCLQFPNSGAACATPAVPTPTPTSTP